jgi:hypothetical protein
LHLRPTNDIAHHKKRKKNGKKKRKFSVGLNRDVIIPAGDDASQDNGTKSRAATMSKANGVDRDENSPANDQPSCMSQAGGAVSLLPGSANRPLGGGAPLQARTGAQRGDTLTFLLIFIKFTMANIFSFGITLRIERI